MKPKPLFVGGPDQTRAELVDAYAKSINATVEPGEFDYTPVIGGVKCYITLASNGDGTWSFAVFEDGPFFQL